MTVASLRHPVVLLCVRCMSCAEIAEHPDARRWVQVVTEHTTLDVCPNCARHILDYLRDTPPPGLVPGQDGSR